MAKEKMPAVYGAEVRCKERIAYRALFQRCLNPRDKAYRHYGARGIGICDRWRGPDGYSNFLQDVGRAPTPDVSLDRIDNDKGYETGNVRWVDARTQRRNQRQQVIRSTRLTPEQRLGIQRRVLAGERLVDLAAEYDTSTFTVRRIRDGQLGKPKPGINESTVVEIWTRLQAGQRGAEIVRELGVSQTVVSQIKTGRCWRHVTSQLPGGEGFRRAKDLISECEAESCGDRLGALARFMRVPREALVEYWEQRQAEQVGVQQ